GNAQGTSAVAGCVRDSSGAVLPGVTIEAASPALIEKVRTVVSDEKGEYKIIDLPGGTYTVSFSLTGFNTIKREGLELTANFTVNVVVEMQVGQLEETITVAGESPIVDVQTTAQHKVVSGDVLYSLPLTKEMGGFAKVNGGAQANLVPKDGGNRFSGMFSFNYAGKGVLSDNLTPELEARGLKAVNTTDRTYDGNVAAGGPIVRDKLWFFASVRGFGYTNLMAADYYNLTQNTPFYTPDVSRPAPQQQDNRSAGVRFTYQVAAKDKLNLSYDIQHTDLCLGCSPLVAPEATYTTS